MPSAFSILSEDIPKGGPLQRGRIRFGLQYVTGNVAEWVEDCYVNSFAAAPRDGSAVVSGNCQRVTRGGGWRANAGDLRIANRSRLSPTTRDTAIGFRVVATE
ncbi:MAG: SUMF1/EgtB/PvdO family nonheme iron enzyme [Hyphomonadaceae bacterium]|nr:SUMF1/EgtB/PvdO family nonheme iron enzyme [Hyphomonadaceae bacterium]